MIKISQLPQAGPYVGDEVFPIVQEGQTRKAQAVFLDYDAPKTDSAVVTWDEFANKYQLEPGNFTVGQAEFDYRFNNNTDDTPAAGRIQLNNADPLLATIMYIHERDTSGNDLSLFLQEMAPGDWVNMHIRNDVNIFYRYDIDSAVSKVGDVWHVPVVVYDTAGTINNGNRVRLYWNQVASGQSFPHAHLTETEYLAIITPDPDVTYFVEDYV